MNITFLIGNGFDLGVGLKTSYNDMYQSYIKKPSNSETIKAFKMDLSRRKPYDKWSDFEMGMAEYAQKLSSEYELIECVRDFKSHMVEHLRKENEKITSIIPRILMIQELKAELNRTKAFFYKELTPNIANQIDDLVSNDMVEYNYIVFNYTTILEFIFRFTSTKDADDNPPLHIHGSLERDVVLGVDDIDQINSSKYELTKKGKRAFIKTAFNEQFDKRRVDKAKRIISNSDVICTYGFSMGESDRTWTKALVDWLIADVNHHLVVYQYDKTEYNQYNFDEIMDIEDEKVEKLKLKLGLSSDALDGQIHIPITGDIFNFDFGIGTPKESNTVEMLL